MRSCARAFWTSALRSMATATRLEGTRTPAQSPHATLQPRATLVLVWSAEHHVAILDLVGKALLRCPQRGVDVGVVLFADTAGVFVCVCVCVFVRVCVIAPALCAQWIVCCVLLCAAKTHVLDKSIRVF